MKRTYWIAGVSTVVVLAVAAALAWYFGVFASPTVQDAPEVQVGDTEVEVIASDLEVPWGLAFLPDGSALVTERDSGRILQVSAAGDVSEIQTVDEAEPGGEGGLLGIAVSPTYADDHLVYVYYTAAADNRIARFRLGETPEPIFTGIPKAGIHNGGRIAFGPDGMLYVGTGDASEGERAQDREYLGGKILRLTLDGAPAPDNPFDSAVYSYGHRNVQGLAWDADDNFYASEFGQNTYDELNLIEPGNNYGWPEVEGTGDDPQYTNPIATWSTSDASPSGIAVAGDRVYMACLRGERLYRIGLDGSDAVALMVDDYGRLRTVVAAPDGSLWITTSNRDGRGDPAEGDDRILRLPL